MDFLNSLRMSAVESAMFTSALEQATHYLEYGAGGSTQLAVRHRQLSSIVSVESDPAYVHDHLHDDDEIQAGMKSGRLRFLFPDIGPTQEWGYPVDDRKIHLWPNYALCPFMQGFQPDLILIDGRFRVACALATALEAPEAVILLHDYSERKRYHVIERFFTIEERAESLVCCRRRAGISENRLRRTLKNYLYCPSDRLPWLPFAWRRRLKGINDQLTNRPVFPPSPPPHLQDPEPAPAAPSVNTG